MIETIQEGDYLVTYVDGVEISRVLNYPETEEERTGLLIAFNKQLYQIGEAISWTIEVRRDDGTLINSNNAYWVPVIRQDGIHSYMLKVQLNGGLASGSFSLNGSGLFHIDLRNVQPKPNMNVSIYDSPRFLVEETVP